MGLSIAGYGSIVSDIASVAAQPFQTFANMISSSVSGFVGYFTIFNELVEENAELRERLSALESAVAEAQAIREENIMLREFYGLREARLDFEWLDARVTAGSAGNYTFGFTLNKGMLHGVERGMPVIAAGGVVGFISEVSFMSSTVSPFIRASNAIGAYIRRTGDIGIIEGDFLLEGARLGRLRVFGRDADIQEGDRIYSSGYGGIYPEGLFIGTVIEVYGDPLTHTPAAYIEPGVNFNKIRDVMIILESDWIFD